MSSAAWPLLRPADPDFWDQINVGPYGMLALVSVPIVVGALGRIPAGLLCDRYGAEIVLRGVSLLAGGALLAVAVAGPLPAPVLAACALGLAGAVFPVGAALVAAAYPPGRRGFALSVYGAGIGGNALTNLAWLAWPDVDRWLLLSLSAGLLACAALSATFLRTDRGVGHRHGFTPGTVGQLLRLPATRRLAAWYAGAVGGVLALALYLPAYLHVMYHLNWHLALLCTAGAVAAAAAARPVGGWLAGRRNPTRLLDVSYAAVAVLGLVLVLRLPLSATIPAVHVMAACLGLAGGVVIALIGNTAPAGRVGTIMGVVGAGGALAAVVPALLLAIAHWRTGSDSVGWAVVAGLPMAFAIYLRGRSGLLGGALAFAAQPAGPVTTVVSLTSTDAERNSEGIIATLGAIASTGDLVVVYGYRDTPSARMTPYALVAGMHARLPRHTIVTAYADAFLWPVGRSMAADLFDRGGVLVICAPTTDIDTIAARLADHLGAAQLLHLTEASIDGFRLTLPWPSDNVVAAR